MSPQSNTYSICGLCSLTIYIIYIAQKRIWLVKNAAMNKIKQNADDNKNTHIPMLQLRASRAWQTRAKSINPFIFQSLPQPLHT